ncbi:MAG: hypothetical protein U1E10_16060, partial [Bdellovibrionales bacterium]|nr:hypothetical protein [Bdellovibrionales bacterium]
QERILASPASHGSLLGAFEVPGRLPKIENLWLTSSFFSDERNTLGSLIQARKVIEDIGDHSTDTDLSKDSEIPRTAEA